MCFRGFLSLFLVTLALLGLSQAPAHAQATRTWVSGVGDDANPCSRTAPCKTFAGAISKTATGGEINCLDPGGFGAVTITKAITISCDAGTAGVLASGTNGIIVNVASTASVLLQGLDIEGAGTGLNGVQVVGSGEVFIRNCQVRHFTGNGVNVVGTAGAHVIIEDSQILFNSGGVNVKGAGGASNAVTVANSYIHANTNFSIQADGAVNSIGLFTSSLTGSTTSIISLNGAPIVSFGGTNHVAGASAPTSTVPLK